MLDASCGGALLCKSYEDNYRLIDSITSNTYKWRVTKAIANSTQKRPDGVRQVINTITLTAQMAQIHQMIKNMMTLEVIKLKLVKVVIDASKAARVYSEGARLFEECSPNPISVNYVGNN
ncbi:hypothetical protein KIW84_054258 [Lathyrus oleraceus]|uniref:Uncharacterized protein n=1 Tax=Pisum sativum TaxID=3888 RepID=A0A9D4WXG2_PEA|nr:hypothetical protein KIW84_054258 [Pisum sativum]